MMARAQAAGLLQVSCANPRDFARDIHRTVDDSPCGGGPGMVMKPTVAVEAVESLDFPSGSPIFVLDPAGAPLSQSLVRELSAASHWTVLCGHYEGFDERIVDILGARKVAVGDVVLTGGELPALMMIDAAARLIPGVLGDPQSHLDDSHGEDGLLGFPLYTKPVEFRGRHVPEVLLSGNHAKIAEWRRRQQLLRTRTLRPDLFARALLTPKDLKLLD
jgi:tRNA (guanine37-N1)-methyltransferase